jgi:hypothetical protein
MALGETHGSASVPVEYLTLCIPRRVRLRSRVTRGESKTSSPEVLRVISICRPVPISTLCTSPRAQVAARQIFAVREGTPCTSPRALLVESMRMKNRLMQQVLQTIWRCMKNASGPLSANTERRAWFQTEIHRNTRRLFDKAPNGKSARNDILNIQNGH